MQQRSHSTAYADHVGLLHTLSKKAYAVTMQHAVISTTYEDIYQMMCESFVKAQQTYNPNFGNAFSTYFGRACWNNFSRWLEGEKNDAEGIGCVNIESLNSTSDEGDEINFADLIEDDMMRSPEEKVEAAQNVRAALRSLSTPAKLVIRELLSPSEGLNTIVATHNEGVANGTINGRTIEQPSVRFIGQQCFGFSARQVAAIKREFGEKFELDM